MRLALQALFSATEADEDGAARRAWLERRLRSSERSAGFARRLRGAVDDASLQAPEIFAEASYPDANVVAEYLDGQTSSEITRAYEDACWESPEMLAEAGRCYDILNNDALNCVVVPKNCRRRLYHIAWEENYVNVVAPQGENAAALTDRDTSETSERENAENVVAARSKSKKKRKKTEKSATSVESTLAAERSWWRRAKRLTWRTSLALGLAAALFYGWQTLSVDRRSETLDLETPKAEALAISIETSENNAEEAPLRPTTIASLGVDELPAPSLTESLDVVESDVFVGYDELDEKAEPPKLAALTEGREEQTPNAERSRVGLGSEEPWDRRPSIEIPAQNNDVFTKAKRY